MISTNPRIAAYLRVSTDVQSTELQRRELEQYVKNQNWTDVSYYEDKATGGNTNRPAFKEMMQAARSRQLNIVLVYKLDRFGRSLRDLVVHLQELTELGITFISLKDQIDLSTSQGRLMAGILGSLAEFERDLIVGRVRGGLENAKARGKRLGRIPRINPEEVVRLRKLGLSLSQIGKQLNVTKSAVSKTLSKLRFPNSLNKSEIIEVSATLNKGE